ncbi:MAG TPA: glutathione S-transferase C-terminal domain-containing protein, partial [Mycoplana sp.]|nr:glutathione S-transferase C-terminal domain-containing protein [Mycoplana sp.]
VFTDGEKVQAFNPLMRVPTLVLDDGDIVADSSSILDYLDGLVPAESRLLPQAEPERRRALRVTTFATGLADKGVTLFYELHLHETPSAYFVERCRAQIAAVLTALNAERAQRPGKFWFGRITHADIAVACAWRHVSEAHPGFIDPATYPALATHCASMEALPVFQEISQPFIAPA